MLDVSDPLVKIGIASVICTVPAIATTIYRLWIRRGRYWADDAWALASAISQFLMFSGSFIHITNSSPKGAMVAAYYLMAAPFYTVVWCARLSILFSIIRIDPSPSRRRILYIVAGLFFLVTVILVTQLFWVCEPEPSWKNNNSPQCILTRQVVVLQLVTDIISDSILIAVPLRIIRHLNDKKLRRRLTVIFSTCLMTTVVSLVHAAFIFIHAGHKEVIAAISEDCVSLIVCNMPIIVTAMLRQRESRKTWNAGPVSLRFATWNSTAKTGDQTTTTGTFDNGAISTVAEGTTTTGWRSNFRWERELDVHSGHDTMSTIEAPGVEVSTVQVQLSSTGKAHQGDQESVHEHPNNDSKKKFWRFQNA